MGDRGSRGSGVLGLKLHVLLEGVGEVTQTTFVHVCTCKCMSMYPCMYVCVLIHCSTPSMY